MKKEPYQYMWLKKVIVIYMWYLMCVKTEKEEGWLLKMNMIALHYIVKDEYDCSTL